LIRDRSEQGVAVMAFEVLDVTEGETGMATVKEMIALMEKTESLSGYR
jgi:hypothetical protein